jgi:hypothetical protein
MSWQGQWAGQSTGSWYGRTSVTLPVPPVQVGGGAFTWIPYPATKSLIAWLTADLSGGGSLGGRIDSHFEVEALPKIRARRVREEEYLRLLH